MPVLDGTRIVGLVDPGRRGDVLMAKQVTLLRPDTAVPVARALAEAASWVGSTSCEVERVEPASARASVRADDGARRLSRPGCLSATSRRALRSSRTS
jgi:hypothetical protein